MRYNYLNMRGMIVEVNIKTVIKYKTMLETKMRT